MTAKERPLRRDAELNRQRILAAAAEMFAARGLSATFDDIAERAGVGVGTLYRRFPNKDALVGALFLEGMQVIVDIADEALTMADPWEAVVFLLHTMVSRQAADRGLRDIFLSYSGLDHLAQGRSDVIEAADRVLDRAKRAGALRPDVAAADVPIICLMLASVSDYTAGVDSSLWRRYLGMLLDGMRVGGVGPSPLPVEALNSREMARVFRRAEPGSG